MNFPIDVKDVKRVKRDSLRVKRVKRDSLSSHATVGTVMRVPNEDFVVRIVLVLADAQKRESGRSGNSVSRHPTGHES